MGATTMRDIILEDFEKIQETENRRFTQHFSLSEPEHKELLEERITNAIGSFCPACGVGGWENRRRRRNKYPVKKAYQLDPNRQHRELSGKKGKSGRRFLRENPWYANFYDKEFLEYFNS